MMDVLMASGLALGLAYAGMAGLCLAMDRHHAQVWRQEPSRGQRWGLQGAGWALLALAVWPCVAAWGGSVGTVVWLGFLTAGALLLVSLLPYAPRGTAWLAMLVAPLALVGLASAVL